MLPNKIQKKSVFINTIITKDWQVSARFQNGKKWSVLCMKDVYWFRSQDFRVLLQKTWYSAEISFLALSFEACYCYKGKKITSCNTYKQPSCTNHCSCQIVSYREVPYTSLRKKKHLRKWRLSKAKKDCKSRPSIKTHVHTQGRILQKPKAWYSCLDIFFESKGKTKNFSKQVNKNTLKSQRTSGKSYSFLGIPENIGNGRLEIFLS